MVRHHVLSVTLCDFCLARSLLLFREYLENKHFMEYIYSTFLPPRIDGKQPVCEEDTNSLMEVRSKTENSQVYAKFGDTLSSTGSL
jgi:hypothetical protein